jgi:hypothetical protein
LPYVFKSGVQITGRELGKTELQQRDSRDNRTLYMVKNVTYLE